MQNEQDDKVAKRSDDEAILAEAKRYIDLCVAADNDDRNDALDDLRFVKGEQWPENIKIARELDGRPCLTINKLPTFLHQVTNDQRQNKPSIKVHPVDSQADPETATVLQGLIRHIEYSSNADVAYDTAVNGAAACGRGFFRLVTDYCRPDSFDQDIKFERIRNPFTVYFDPNSKEPDGSDQLRSALVVDMPRWEFKQQYPKADLDTSSVDVGGVPWAGWITEDTVRVAIYYRVEFKDTELVRLSDGSEGFLDDLDQKAMTAAGISIQHRRKTQKRSVWLYKHTSREVLEKTEFPCDWIPVFPVWGDELDINGKVFRSGVIRHAKDPQRMYNVWMTHATEEVGLRPKAPYIMAEGQEEGHEQEWATANQRSYSYLTYKPTSIGGSLAPPPQRQQMADLPVGALQMAMHANDNIKATTGLFDSSLGANGSATSGRQEVAQQRQGDVANFHFTDNLNRTVRHVGRCLINAIPRVYDTPRVVRILGDDETPGFAEINAKKVEQGEGGAIERVLNDLKVGQYDVTVKAGPSYDTLRQEAVQSMVELGQAWPKLMDVAGDVVVKSMDWPGAEEIGERIKKTIPAEITRDEEEGQEAEIPPEIQAELQQLQQQNQELQQALAEAQSGIQKAQIDAASRERVAEINAVSRNDVEELKGVVALLLQKLQPPPQLAADAMVEGKAGGSSPPPEQTPDEAPTGAFSLPEQE